MRAPLPLAMLQRSPEGFRAPARLRSLASAAAVPTRPAPRAFVRRSRFCSPCSRTAQQPRPTYSRILGCRDAPDVLVRNWRTIRLRPGLTNDIWVKCVKFNEKDIQSVSWDHQSALASADVVRGTAPIPKNHGRGMTSGAGAGLGVPWTSARWPPSAAQIGMAVGLTRGGRRSRGNCPPGLAQPAPLRSARSRRTPC
jgi:hypothetical protein